MDTRAASRRSSLSAVDFILIAIIIGLLTVICGVLAMRLLPDANPVILIVATPTITLTPAPTTPPTPSPTWTNTPTPTHTRTPTPTATWTSTPTSPPPPLANLALTVTPLPAAEVMSGTFGTLPPPAPLREFKPNTLNIILMGSDRRPNEGGWRTDTMIFVSVDPDVPSLTMLSIPRDLWVYVPNWKWTRINLADGYGERTGFPGGGPGLLKQTIQYNFGIPVQYYARVDFGGFKALIDAVGGIDVVADCALYDIFPDVPEGVTDIVNGPDLATVLTGTIDIPSAGIYHLDGKHALWYARSRKTTSDFDRSRRQHRVLRGLWSAIQQQGLVGQLPALWDTLNQTVQTDLTLNDVVYLAQLGTQLDSTHIRSRFIDGTMLHYFVSDNGASVYAFNYDELAPVLDEAFAEFPSNAASQAPAAVEVWNGAGNPDWEIVAAERLSWAGFQAWPNGIADRLYERTTIVDFTTTQKGSRLPQLVRLFRVPGADVVYQPDAVSLVPYRVILGQNFDPCLRGAPVPVATATPTPTFVPTTP